MNLERATELLWDSTQRGAAAPAELAQQLSIEDGLQVQLAILDRRLEAGERQIGWKLAGTAALTRERLHIQKPLCAYLMEQGRSESGAEVKISEGTFLFECELLVTLGKRLTGPGVDRAQVVAAVDRVEAAFELAQLRVNVADDTGLAVADGVAAWGVVVGEAASPHGLDLGAIRVVATKNGEALFDVVSRDAVDDQFESIAALANDLGALGRTIEAGQCVLTGSFGNPAPITRGDRFEAQLSSVGSVSVQIR